MSYWERNTLFILIGSVVGGMFYFAVVVQQSLAAGSIVMPHLWVWLGYMVLQFAISVGGVFIFNRKLMKDVEDLPGGQDERDRLIKGQAEGWQGHIMSAAIFVALGLWFVHQNQALLFHSIVAAMVISEIGRSLIQHFAYNRAI